MGSRPPGPDHAARPRWFGFEPRPPAFFVALVTMVVAYLGLVELVKCWFYRRYLV